MATQCFKKKESNPPTCCVHNVPLEPRQLPVELAAAGLKASAFLICPVSDQVLTDEETNFELGHQPFAVPGAIQNRTRR